MKVIINEIPLEVDFDYGQIVFFLKDGEPKAGRINGVSVLAKPKSGSHNNRYLIAFSVYDDGEETIMPYGCIANTAEKAYGAVTPILLFVSRSGKITERHPRDWLVPEFTKSMGEFLIHFFAKC